MRTFPLFDPKISAILLFKAKEGQGTSAQDAAASLFKGRSGMRVESSVKGDWIAVELAFDLVEERLSSISISPDLFKVRYEEMKPHISRLKDAIHGHVAGGSSVTCLTFLTCGSEESVWTKKYSDVSYLYKDRDATDKLPMIASDTYQSNVAYLNRIFGLGGKVLVNTARHGNVNAMLFLLGFSPTATGVPKDPFMLLELDLSALKTQEVYRNPLITVKERTPYQLDENPDRGTYQLRQNYLINLVGIKSRIIDLMLFKARLEDSIAREQADLRSRSGILLEEIFSLQNEINEHMKRYSPDYSGADGISKKLREKETYRLEKELLTKASVKFSLVSEVENGIMRENSKLQDMALSIKDKELMINLEYDSRSTEDAPLTISDVMLKRIENEMRSLRSLSEELMHSRVILTSTIEVLRTFVDSRQREISGDMSRLMNLLFLVFACIGLADALGNFVILVLEYGYLGDDPTIYDVYSVTSMGLILTLVPLLMAAIFLYLYFKKK